MPLLETRASCKPRVRNLTLNFSELQGLSKQTVVTVCTAEFQSSPSSGEEKATDSLSLTVLLLSWNKTFQSLKLKLWEAATFYGGFSPFKYLQGSKGQRFYHWNLNQIHFLDVNLSVNFTCKVPEVYKCESSVTLDCYQCGVDCTSSMKKVKWTHAAVFITVHCELSLHKTLVSLPETGCANSNNGHFWCSPSWVPIYLHWSVNSQEGEENLVTSILFHLVAWNADLSVSKLVCRLQQGRDDRGECACLASLMYRCNHVNLVMFASIWFHFSL